MTNEITSEPTAAAPPVYEIVSDPKHDELEDTAAKIPSLNSIYNKFFTRDGWLGDYDYAFLCMPTIPCLGKKSTRQPPFFGLKTKLPVLLATVMGKQSSTCFFCFSFFFGRP